MNPTPNRLSIAEFASLAALLFSLVALSIDAMLPAMGEIANDLGVADRNDAQLVIGVFFLGNAFGQLLFGPLSDTFGRKRVIVAGLALFLFGCLVSVVAQANCVDRFADALELERVSLPEPVEGEPTRLVPEAAEVRLHWVPTDDIGGPNVYLALSAVPAELVARSALSTPHYLEGQAVFGDVVSDRFSLQRVQIELVAGRTSKLNECFY